MKALVTAPAKYVHFSLAGESTMVFGLGHLIKDSSWQGLVYTNQLRHASKNCGAYLIIDNGVTEIGNAMPLSELISSAKKVAANEIVLPDKFGHSALTREYVRNAIRAIDGIGGIPYQCMAVLHCDGIQDLIDTLGEWADYPEIKVIGIPKRQTVSEWWSFGRISILRAMELRGYHVRFNVHMLGVWEDMRETYMIAHEFPWVRSIDTSWPVMAGLHGIDIEEHPKTKIHYVPHPENLWDVDMVLRNIQTYRRWARGE